MPESTKNSWRGRAQRDAAGGGAAGCGGSATARRQAGSAAVQRRGGVRRGWERCGRWRGGMRQQWCGVARDADGDAAGGGAARFRSGAGKLQRTRDAAARQRDERRIAAARCRGAAERHGTAGFNDAARFAAQPETTRAPGFPHGAPAPRRCSAGDSARPPARPRWRWQAPPGFSRRTSSRWGA